VSVTYGFYNAINHDRSYNSSQISDIFDGIINDGVFQSIGTALVVKASSGMTVNVGVGRAWFNRTWTFNDAVLPLVVSDAELLLGRIDAVVLEVDSTETVRANSIKIIKGTPSSSPVAPTMVSTNYIHQYPLAYISVAVNTTEILETDITNCVGTTSTPFVTGILKTLDISELLAQWQAQWTTWLATRDSEKATYNEMWETWYKSVQDTQVSNQASWKSSFDSWFTNLKNELDSNQAANLQNQINKIQYYIDTIASLTTFPDQNHILCTYSDNCYMSTTFNTDGTISKVLYQADGTKIAGIKTTFNTDGSIKKELV
jgi:hypothetical protein